MAVSRRAAARMQPGGMKQKDGMNDQISKIRTKFEHHTIYFAMLCRSLYAT